MRTEPTELHISSRSRRPSFLGHALQIPQSSESNPQPQAIDEAFAAIGESTGEEFQLHQADSSEEAKESIRQNQAMVASMVSQLEALDRQRKHLSELLAGVDSQVIAD